MFEDFKLEDDMAEPEGDSHDRQALKPPRANPLCLGHDAVQMALLNLYNQGKLPHAIALTGQKGIGKATLAYRFARFLLAEDQGSDALFGGESFAASSLEVSEDNPVFRKIASGGHPDLLTIERVYDEEKKRMQTELMVGHIRKLSAFFRTTSAYGGWRICIIDDADSMNIQAQNALLKILEEPPHKVLIILVAHRMGVFLPTIRSRLRLFHLKELNYNDFSYLLDFFDCDSKDMNLVYALSAGSIGAAGAILDQDSLPAINKIMSCFSQPKDRITDLLSVIKLSDQLALKGREDHYMFFTLFMSRLAQDMVLAKARNDASDTNLLSCLRQYDGFSSLEAFFHRQSLEGLVRIAHDLGQHFEQVSRAHLDKKYGVLQAFEILTGQKHDG